MVFKTILVWSIKLIWFITGFAKSFGQFSIGANTIEKLWKNTKRDSTDKKVMDYIFINVFDINIALGSPVNKVG